VRPVGEHREFGAELGVHAWFVAFVRSERHADGGEEFAVVIPDASIPAYEKCAMRVIDSVRRLGIAHEQNGGWDIVTVSIGACRRETSSGSVSILFRDADAALYRAKKIGRNRIEFAD